MPGRGPQTFKKRQKEQQRKERQQEKMARRIARKDAVPGSSSEEENTIDENSTEPTANIEPNNEHTSVSES